MATPKRPSTPSGRSLEVNESDEISSDIHHIPDGESSGADNHSLPPAEDSDSDRRSDIDSECGIPNKTRTDVLYSLRVVDSNGFVRHFYRDSPWKGISSGLPGSEPDPLEEDLDCVLIHNVSGVVRNHTEKASNTPRNWRQSPEEFELGHDATLLERHDPWLQIYSNDLLTLVDTILDYWPYRGDHRIFSTIRRDNFVMLMACYAELREYFNQYVNSLAEEDRVHPKLAIDSCGDENITGLRRPYLDFGALDVTGEICKEQTAYDLAVLLRLLAGMYREKVVPALTSLLVDVNPMVQYRDLWILFRPGTVVYVKEAALGDGHQGLRMRRSRSTQDPQECEQFSGCIVAEWAYSRVSASERDNSDSDTDEPNGPNDTRHVFELLMWNVQYDGSAFQRIVQRLSIDEYDGNRSLWDLPVIPSRRFDENDNGVLRERLETRGHKYLSIAKEPAAFRTYTHSLYEGPIIIDPDAYRQHRYDAEPGSGRSAILHLRDHQSNNIGDKIGDGGAGPRLRGLVNFSPAESEQFPLLKETVILLPRTAEGFALKTKRWMVFEIDSISEQEPLSVDNQVESELILVSDKDKDVLRTVLPRGQHPVGVTRDFVDGKGEGKIFLLYGGPGTGKTLTVECIANDTRRPLLRLTAQDVGLSEKVESHLRKWFTLAAKWNAILLIDEADLFLEQRREGDLERNSLSTVFLRTMEYYKGVLFLTTNRPGHIDDSFISRITYPIFYPALSPETKKRLVEKFVLRFEETNTVEFEQAAVRHLKNNCEEFNGRQIRNVLQNAVASAEISLRTKRRSGKAHDHELVHVNLGQMKAAAERQSEFQEYLRELRGRDEKSRARKKQDYLDLPPSPR